MPSTAHHKIWPSKPGGPKIFGPLGLAAILGLFLLAATAQRDTVFVDGKIDFVDADCYSRMSRAAQVFAHPFRSIRHHDFENFPAGVDTHTTAPLDWLIALLAVALSPFSPQALDLAGAWISPLLGLATLLLLWLWATRERLPFRGAMVLLVAVSPVAAQAFRLGRPDHQSLLMLFLAAGLAAEWTLWTRPSRRTAIAWGATWGCALWTSLYEPLVLFGFLLALRAAHYATHPGSARAPSLSAPRSAGWITFAVVTLTALAFDGWRVSRPSPEVTEYFANWSKGIAELAHLSPLSMQFPGWLGWLAPVLPALLVWRFVAVRDARILAILTLLLATSALTCWQIRWGCYLALVAAIALPFALAAIPSRALAWTAFFFSLLPVASQWDALTNPDASARAALQEQRADYAQLREIAAALVSNERTGILAPWWLSPPLAYWSGQPCVAGSSHESLPGTVDAARFYLATDDTAARDILRRRGVRYVLAYEPARVLGNSAQLLGEPIEPNALGGLLYRDNGQIVPGLTRVAAWPWYKIYEVKRDGL